MKKLILVLAMVLIATPAFADTPVTVTLSVHDTNKIDINYSFVGASERPRAFALDVNITPPAKFTAISNYMKGVSKRDPNHPTDVNHLGYGIYPARMTFKLNPEKSDYLVDSNGNPLADDVNDPGASGTGLGKSRVILEFGSLYYNRDPNFHNEPLPSGRLCTLTADCNGASSNPTVKLKEEETYRGGIVLENGNTPPVVSFSTNIVCACIPQPVQATTPTPASPTSGVSMFPTKPTLNWTPAAGGSNAKYDVYFGTATTPATVISTNQTTTSCNLQTLTPTVSVLQGKTYYWKVVSKNDCDTIGVSSEVWNFNTYCLRTTDTGYVWWNFLDRPSCFCFRRHCRGDSNGSMTANKPVLASDFTTFVSGYNLKYTQMIGKVDGNLVPSICADWNHLATASKPVLASDFTIFQTYYNLKITQGVPECPMTTIYFWTN